MKVAGFSKVIRPVTGLRLKISLLLLAIQVPFLAILAYETARGFKDTFQSFARVQASRLAEELNRRLAELPGPESYQAELEEFFRSMSGVHATSAVLLAEGEKLVCRASWGKNARTETSEEVLRVFESGRLLETTLPDAAVVHVPLRASDESVIGVIRLELDQSENARHVRSASQQLFAGMVIIFALSLVVLYVGMHLMVVRPALNVAEAMAGAREGRLEAVAVGSAQDEIGWLARSYNDMVQRLRALLGEKEGLLAEVQDLNQNLQNKVDEATQDLAASHRDLQKAYHDLYASQRELQRLERLASLGQVAREIAHEFATPLNVISGTLQMLLEDPALKPDHRERLQRLLKTTERLIQISRDTLSPLKMPAPELRPSNLNALVQEVGAFMAPAFAARGVEFILRLSANLPLVRADIHQIEQVLLNIISNALDALPRGGRIEVETGVDAGRGPRSVVLRIRDDGVGIAPEHLPHIFDPFFTTKGAGRGTGLGLAICKDILVQHRGEIRLNSRPGKGSAVLVKIPAIEEQPAIEGGAAA